MELRSCGHLHFIQAIKGGSVTKILNVARGRPTLSFKNVIEIYGSFIFDENNVDVERSCISEKEKRTVKTEPDASACNASDGEDDEGSCILEDCSFGNLTLKQIQDRCKTKKRKQHLEASTRKIKIEASSSLEQCNENYTAADDSEFMETLSSWRSKLSKNKKAKRRRIKDPESTITQDVMSVLKSKVIQNSQKSPSSGEDSAALVEVKVEVPEVDCSDHLRMAYNASNDFQACHWPEDSLGIVAIEEPETARECILGNEVDYEWTMHADIIPLQMAWASSMDILASDLKLSSDQSLNLSAIQFKIEECIIQPDLQLISPQAINLAEDRNTDLDSNQLDSDTAVTPPITNKDLHCVDLGNEGDGAFFSDCSKDEFISDAKLQAKISPVSEHIFNPDGCRDASSDSSPESEEKQLLGSVNVDKERHVSEATDELIFWDGYRCSSKMHRPQRLLSARKAISPSSQIRLCKAMQSIDLHDKDRMTCRGKLYFGEQTADEKKGTAEGLDETIRARTTKRCNKISMIPKPLKRVSQPQGIQKSSHPSRSTARLGAGHTSMQSCAKSAIAFSRRQMHDAECLAMKLTNELKSMKDIMGDMLRSELCLTTSLRYKVNEARIAVKNAARAEETAKRSLSIMARDCSRFCKLMQLADEGPPAPQDVATKKSKKIAFADEAGGRLCQVKFYENEEGSSLESDRKELLP